MICLVTSQTILMICSLDIRSLQMSLLGLNTGSKKVTPAILSLTWTVHFKCLCGYLVPVSFTSAARVEKAVCKVLWQLPINRKIQVTCQAIKQTRLVILEHYQASQHITAHWTSLVNLNEHYSQSLEINNTATFNVCTLSMCNFNKLGYKYHHDHKKKSNLILATAVRLSKLNFVVTNYQQSLRF